MKRYIQTLILILSLALYLPFSQSCTSDTELDRQPEAVQKIIEQYYPGVGVSSSAWQGKVYVVKLRSGVIFNFNTDFDWTSLNGVGSILPSVFLFDQLPPALYEYLQATESVNSVYRVDRDKDGYVVELQSNSVVYDTETGTITIPASGDILSHYFSIPASPATRGITRTNY